ncbi:MAG TPA: PAS domain-containing sensor histidine kinase, partial [Vicinamibacteria bacterium]|nr:PAS domain-containing sensor histidine kinase [Vicinamibacteria bacterium]
ANVAVFLLAAPAQTVLRVGAWDAFAAASAAAFVVACALRPDRPRRWLGMAFDLAVLAVLAVHTWLYFAAPFALTGARPPAGWVEQILDARAAALALAAFWLLQGARGPWRSAYVQLAGAIVLLFAGSAVSNRAMNAGAYHPGLWTLPWTAPFLWIALVARAYSGMRQQAGPAASGPEWADLRRGTLIALMGTVFVPALEFIAGLVSGPGLVRGMPPAMHVEVARWRAALCLVTTVAVLGLLVWRQFHLLRWAERVQTESEDALRVSERRYRHLFERNLAGFFRITTGGRFLECNDALVRILRYGSREELMRMRVTDLYCDPATAVADIRRLEETGLLINNEVCLRRPDGSTAWIVENAILVRDEEGRRTVEGTVIDITARRAAEEQTRRLAEMKTSFLVVASHEMRTPLTVLTGYHGILAESGLTEAQRHALDVCQRSVGRLGRTFDHVLSTLEITEGRVPLRPGLVQLGRLAADVLRDLALIFARRQQRPLLEVEDGLRPVWADEDKVREVIWNLVENAIKFTPDGGEIRVRVGSAGAWHQVTVEDSGIGIEPEELDHIWERFYAGSRPHFHSSGTFQFQARGNGLGLAIAKGYVEAHGGRVTAASAGSGRGAVFRVFLPSAEPAVRPSGRGATGPGPSSPPPPALSAPPVPAACP